MASSGELLRSARVRAGLTQAELAARAGITQSVISAYEHDRRHPALSTLVDSCGPPVSSSTSASALGVARSTG